MRRFDTPKQILYSILSILPQVYNEFGKEEKYKALLNFLTARDYYNDDDIPYPSMKEIQEATKLTAPQLGKLLTEIHDNLFNYETDFTFDFNVTHIRIYVSGLFGSASFLCNSLKYLPKIGENITLYFLKAKVGTDYFYVQDIRHTFEENKQIISISLKEGRFNSYWYYRKHKAQELNELRFEDFGLTEYDIKRKLGIS